MLEIIGMLFMNLWFWVGCTFLFFILWLLWSLIIVMFVMKTHASVELAAWIKGNPIALFFQENRYCEWKVVTPDAGIIEDKKYGTFIINEKATYVDKRTKNILLPFDASIATSINVHAAKLAEDLQYVTKDEEEFKRLRRAIGTGDIDENESINAIRTTVNFGALKYMLTALTPHNINAKIQMEIARKLKSMGIDNMKIVLYLAGALILGVVLTLLAQWGM